MPLINNFLPAVSILRPLRRPLCRSTFVRAPSRQPLRRSYARVSHYSAPYQSGWGVLYAFIGINAAVFSAWQYALPGGLGPFSGSSNLRLARVLQENFFISSMSFQNGKRWWTLFTSSISHIEIGHFLTNMISLYAFSSVLLYSGIPGRHLAALIIGSGIMGSLGSLQHDKSKPANKRRPALGASGAVMGVGAAAALLVPQARMALLGIIPLPLWSVIAGYFAFDAYYLNSENTRIGHAGHLGGLAFGVLYYVLALRGFGGVLSRRGPF